MSKTIKFFNYGVVAMLLAAAFAIPVLAQTQDDPLVAECNSMYEKFLADRKEKAGAAYATAKQYLQKCPGKAPDVEKYLSGWVEKYEWAKLLIDFKTSFEGKKFADVYKYGKQILAKEPENLEVIMKMGLTGFYVGGSKEKASYADGETYAKMAIQKIEAGQTPSKWEPFKSKEDALGYLYYALGLIARDSTPKESAKYFYKITKIEGPLKTDASTYAQIASYYHSEYLKKVEEVKVKCPEGAPDSEECKALDNDVNARLDRWADALARAISYSTNQTEKDGWIATLKKIFGQRYNKPDAVTDYVANIQKTPMPDPDSELKPAPIMEVTAATTTNATGAITATTTTETSVGPTTNSTDTTESNSKAATTAKAAPKATKKAAPKSTTKTAHKKGKGKRP